MLRLRESAQGLGPAGEPGEHLRAGGAQLHVTEPHSTDRGVIGTITLRDALLIL